MGKKVEVGALALVMSLLSVEQVMAGSFWWCPPVPEFDGSGSIAAIGLLMSIGAVLLRRSADR